MVVADSCLEGYNSKGEPLIAGVVPLTVDKRYVLLIQSTKSKGEGWALPQSSWETDEECTEAAERTAYEEAGISIQIDYDLGDIVDSQPPKHSSKNYTRSLYRFYEVTVMREEDEWPTTHKRERRWMAYAEAKDALYQRPQMQEALSRSTMKR